MDKEIILSTLKKARETSPKRNFKQSIDLIMNLRQLDLKKPEHQMNMFIALPYSINKKISVCAFVDTDMEQRAKEACDEVITPDQFEKYKQKATVKKLAGKHDVFVAQASIMPRVATVFGRYLGPRGKMPNPKAGGVLAPNTNIKQLYERLQKTVSLVTKNEPTLKCRVGNEDSTDEQITENVLTIYNNVITKLPNDIQNVKSTMIKLTMGPAFAIGAVESKDTEKTGSKAKKKVKAIPIKTENAQETKVEGNKEKPKKTPKAKKEQ